MRRVTDKFVLKILHGIVAVWLGILSPLGDTRTAAGLDRDAVGRISWTR